MSIEEIIKASENYYFIIADGKIYTSEGYCNDIHLGEEVFDLTVSERPKEENIITYSRKISDIEDKDELEKECIGRFRKMWTYISELSAEEHRCVTKKEAIKTLYPDDFDDLTKHLYCYLCYCADDCKSCPVQWDGCGKSCGSSSCYGKWVGACYTDDYAEASKYAAKIATLPLRGEKLILRGPYEYDKDSFYGYVGEETAMKDEDGNVLCVGDVVEIKSYGYKTTQIVVHPYCDYPFIMGIYGSCKENGYINCDWSVKLITSYKELKSGDTVFTFKVEEA